MTANQQIKNVICPVVCLVHVFLTWILDLLRPFLLSWHWRMCSSCSQSTRGHGTRSRRSHLTPWSYRRKLGKVTHHWLVHWGDRCSSFILFSASRQQNQSTLPDPGVFVLLPVFYDSAVVQHITFTEDLKRRKRLLSFIHSSIKKQRRYARFEMFCVILPSSGRNEYAKHSFFPP